jgi:hypothetical protein
MPDFSTFKWLGFSGQGHGREGAGHISNDRPNMPLGGFTAKQKLTMAA